MISAVVVALSYAAIEIINKTEIGTEKYVQISEIKQTDPMLNEKIIKFMADGKLSIV